MISCAEDVEVALPSLSELAQPSLPSVLELAVITPIVQFRKTAEDLGMATRVCKFDGSGLAQHTKPDILDDYKRKPDESPAASAASEPAASSSSAMCPPPSKWVARTRV